MELSGTVACDEVYVVAGHNGHPESVKKRRVARKRRLKGPRGRGTAATDKPPILGMFQRGGHDELVAVSPPHRGGSTRRKVGVRPYVSI